MMRKHSFIVSIWSPSVCLTRNTLHMVFSGIWVSTHHCRTSTGDSIVFILPLATMLTYPGGVRTQTLRGLLQHHALLHVTSRNNCRTFLKSYNFPEDPSRSSPTNMQLTITLTHYMAYWSQIEKAIPIKCVKHGIVSHEINNFLGANNKLVTIVKCHAIFDAESD